MIQYEITPAGDLALYTEVRMDCNYGEYLKFFCDEFFPNTGFRFISDHEKIRLGDLTDAPILTDLDIFDDLHTGEGFDGLSEEEIGDLWNHRSWVFTNYQLESFLETLFTKGKVVFTARKNA